MLSRAFDHICMEKARYKFLIIIIIIIIIIIKIDGLVQSCQLACSRHSGSRAQSSDGGERIESYVGKTLGEMRRDWSVFHLHSTF